MLRYKILLAPFPFGDLKTKKFRPVLCLTEPKGRHKELILAYITSNIRNNRLESDLIIKEADKDFEKTGLKTSSSIKLNKLLTLPQEMIVGQIGVLSKKRISVLRKKIKNLFE